MNLLTYFKKAQILLLLIAPAFIAENYCNGAEPAALLLPRALPFVSGNPGKMVDASRDLISLRSVNGFAYGQGPTRHVSHVLNLTHGKVDPDGPGQNTIPHWSDSFTYNGLVYTYTMVGTDPRQGSATTVIPTVLIPLRFVFADGNVFDATTDVVDGQTPIQGIINSPIFQNYDFNNNAGILIGGESAGLVRVGNTQYGDAFQRANFWNSVSTSSPNYHVLLGQPTVLPVQTVNVPYGSFFYYYDPIFGPEPLVNAQFLFDLINPLLTDANVSPGTLPIIVWGQVEGEVVGGTVGAAHGVTSLNGNGLQTFIVTSYSPGQFYQFPGLSVVFAQDVYPLSHELAEWIDDPFGNNFTPGWDIPFLSPPNVRCDSSNVDGDLSASGPDDRLEVGDPVEIFVNSDVALPSATYTYHVTETVFIDFFTRASRSRSYNGQYSFFEMVSPFGLITPPSAPCTGHVEFTPTYVDYPGATVTVVTGLNNNGLAIGFYNDPIGPQHGFTFDGSNYSTLDYPGSLLTQPSKINDAGMIAGTFVDASGVPHGFSYQRGQWSQIDFPGASDTEVWGINASGDIVGVYDGTQPVTHAFFLRNGQYQRIDTPFGTQAEAFAINDPGSITGLGYTDPFGPATSFILSHNSLSPFQFPGSIFTSLASINNSNDVAGYFVDPDGISWGMVTVFGSPYVVYAALWGSDEFDRVLGYTLDNTGRPRGLIGTLPLQRNQH